MANRYYGLNRGKTEFTGDAAGTQGVTEGSSSGSTDVEININTSNITNKNEVVFLVEQLKNWILKNKGKFLAD